jgi:hypothetical protein
VPNAQDFNRIPSGYPVRDEIRRKLRDNKFARAIFKADLAGLGKLSQALYSVVDCPANSVCRRQRASAFNV